METTTQAVTSEQKERARLLAFLEEEARTHAAALDAGTPVNLKLGKVRPAWSTRSL